MDDPGRFQESKPPIPADAPPKWPLGPRTTVALLVVAAAAVTWLGLYVNNHWTRWDRDWKEARVGWKVETRSGPYLKVKKDFLADVEAGRLDAAYQATTPDFRVRYGRAEFEAAVRRYNEFRNRPGARNDAGPSPIVFEYPMDHLLGKGKPATDEKPIGYSLSGGDFWTAADGSRIRVWFNIAQRPDSYFHRRPPPIAVDTFTVTYVDRKGEEVPGR